MRLGGWGVAEGEAKVAYKAGERKKAAFKMIISQKVREKKRKRERWHRKKGENQTVGDCKNLQTKRVKECGGVTKHGVKRWGKKGDKPKPRDKKTGKRVRKEKSHEG